ncbi:MAG: tyrosine-protein phosphatase [Candidatus Riflebacteria bacterium]|nr:tyrosine-protein phosphatase [Candidatus Riflebacteria bacterium]
MGLTKEQAENLNELCGFNKVWQKPDPTVRLLRQVPLPATIPGKLFLHNMPGRREPLEACFAEITAASCYRIICLAGMEEIARKSPDYAKALGDEKTPCPVVPFPVGDYGVPDETDNARRQINDIAGDLHRGKNMLIHCAGGKGRTGMFAICVLIALGIDVETASSVVQQHGSSPDTPEQTAFIHEFRRYIYANTHFGG